MIKVEQLEFCVVQKVPLVNVPSIRLCIEGKCGFLGLMPCSSTGWLCDFATSLGCCGHPVPTSQTCHED